MRKLFYLLFCTAALTTARAASTDVFVPNKGQIADTKGQLHPEILYKYQGNNANLYFQKDRLIYHFIRSEEKPQSEYTQQDHENLRNGNLAAIGKKVYFHRMDLVFEGANPEVKLVNEEKEKSYSNYYLGHCPDGILNVEHYTKIVYKNIYEGIDLAFYFQDGKLKYDFIVSPGADASQIKLVYEGAESIEQLSSGEILVKTPVASLTEGMPYTYDKTSGKEIASKYVLNGTTISFGVGDNLYNGTTVIDPTVTWATYYGNGSSSDTWTKPTFDATGAFYNAGYTYYTTFPVLNAGGGQYFDNTKEGITDLVIVKFSSSYAYAWATYYGGNDGEYLAGYTDYGKALAVDASNNVYVGGLTQSTTFPTLNPGGGAFYQDQSRVFSETSFFVKLNSSGVRQWASIYQHTNANTMSGGIRINGICIGGNGLYFTGQTYRFNSNDIPLVTLAGAYNNATWRGPQDVFIGRFNTTTYALEWSSYLNDGGVVNASYRQGCDLHYDNSGLWFVGRHTASVGNSGHLLLNAGGGAYYQATNAGDQDLIITKFNTSLSVTHSTYYGGDNQDIPSMINSNSSGDAAIVLRAARSTNFPVFDPGGGAYYQPTRAYVSASDADAAIIKFSSAMVRQWATYYGGSAGPSLFSGVGFDNSNNIYVFGSTTANNFPLQNLAGSYNDNTLGGLGDAVLLRFTNGGVRQWATYYGGSATESLYSPKGEVMATGCGIKLLAFPYSGSNDFPTTNPGGGAFFEGTTSTANTNTILLMEETGGGLSTAPTAASATATTICSGTSTTLSFTGGSLGSGASWQWYSGSCGGTSVGSGTTVSVSPTTTTTYFVRAEGTCNTTACQSVTITVNNPSVAPTAANATSTTICSGNSTTLSFTGGTLGTGASWQWYSGSCGGTSVGSGTSVSVSPTTTTTYFVRAEGTCNTTTCQQVTITVNTPSVAPASAVATTPTICSGNSTSITVSGGSLGTGASWQWYTGSCGGTMIGSGSSITVSPISTTTYFVRAEGTCNNTTCASVTVTVNTLSTAPTSAGATSTTICAGNSSTLSVTGGSLGTGASFQWYSGSCGGSFVGSGSTLPVSPTSTTTYFVRAEGTCNITACQSVTINVNTPSVAPTSAGATSSTICTGGSSTLSVTGGTLGTGASWQWYSGSCGGTPVGSGTSVTVSPTSTTTYFVRAEGTCNNTTCASVTITVGTNSTPATAATAASPTICTGFSTTVSVTGGSLGTGANWQWYTGSCGGTLAGSGSSITVSPTTTTTYFVRAEGTCNTTTCQSVTVTVNTASTAPTAAAATSTTICPGASTSLSVTGGSLGSGAAWQWYSGSCGGTLVGSGSPLTVSPASTTTYFVRAEGPCNTTICQSVTITVNTNSTAPATATATSTTICSGNSTTLSFTGGTLGTGAAWQWYEGSCGGTPAGSGSTLTVSPTTTTTYFVRAEGTCNTTTCVSVTITVNTPSTAPTGITPTATTVCSGSNVTLTATGATLGTGAVYNWYSGSCGGTMVGTGVSITIPVTTTTTYFVRAEGTCNTTTCESVTINAVPGTTLPTAINATANPVCAGSPVTLSFTDGTLATGADWEWYSGSCGGTAEGSGSTLTVSPTVTTTYFVRAEGGTCGVSACQSITVTVNTVSTAPTSITPSVTSICSGGTVTLTANGGTLGTGAQYTWYAGSCNTAVIGTGSSITVNPTTGTTYFVNIVGACNTTACQQVTIGMETLNVAPSSINASSTNLCSGPITLTQTGGSLGTGAQYTWYEGSCGGTVVGSGSSITVSPTAATTYFVNVTGGCNTTTCASIGITASTVPAAWTPPTPGVCVSAADLDLNTLLGSTPSTGTWYGPGVTGNMFDPTGLSGTVTLSYVLGTGGACSDSVAHGVTILAAPAAPVVTASTESICSGATVTISATGTANVYTASAGGTNLGAAPVTVSPTATTTYYVEAVNAAGCVNEGGRVPITITVFPSPTANAGPDRQICVGEDLTLTATGGGTYSWSNGDNTASITVTPGGDISYWVMVSLGGCSDRDTVNVNVITASDVFALDDNAGLTNGTSVTTDVAANDSGDPSTVVIVTPPANGTAMVNSAGEIVYTPNVGFNGTDELTYRICHTTCDEVCTTAKLIIEVKRDFEIKIPGGISPNGDGINEVWHISGLEAYPENEVVIFNRWGDIVFTAAPYLNDWKGQSNNTKLKLGGNEVVDGTYFYIIKLSPDEKEINGPIEVIRNK